MKTKKDWDGSGQDLTHFLQVGDLVDEDMYWFFIEVLPPACFSSRCVQIGEAYSHNEHGRLTFATLTHTADGWQYAGNIVTPDGERCTYIT